MASRFQQFMQTSRVCGTCGKVWYLAHFHATKSDVFAMTCDTCKKGSGEEALPATKVLPPCLCYFCQQREQNSANSNSER